MTLMLLIKHDELPTVMNYFQILCRHKDDCEIKFENKSGEIYVTLNQGKRNQDMTNG